MRTIKLNNKLYTVPAETIVSYLAYRHIVENNINAEDAIHMYAENFKSYYSYLAYRRIVDNDINAGDAIHVYIENIKSYYAEKEMAYNNISFDNDLIPALEKIALDLI